jgi:D-threonate/D-erythronate kinase
MRVFVFADDATGALEVGAKFAKDGISTRVLLSGWQASDEVNADETVLVVDTASRHRSPDDAREILKDLTNYALNRGADLLLKKTDSTLRGNIAAEIAGMLEAAPERWVGYCPAYPTLGRTVQGGQLLVNGLPVHETAFGRDPLNPVTTSHLPTLLKQAINDVRLCLDHEQWMEAVSEAVPGMILVADAQSEEHVDASVEACLPYRNAILAGPANLAGCISKRIQRTEKPRDVAWPTAARILLVVGSQHPASLAQLKEARLSGVAHYQLRPGGGQSMATAGGLAYAMQKDGIGAISCTPDSFPSPVAAAEEMAALVRTLMDQTDFDALVVFGGDTTQAILHQMRVTSIVPNSELAAGIAASQISLGGRPIWLITKAGGFGGVNLVYALRQILGSY